MLLFTFFSAIKFIGKLMMDLNGINNMHNRKVKHLNKNIGEEI